MEITLNNVKTLDHLMGIIATKYFWIKIRSDERTEYNDNHICKTDKSIQTFSPDVIIPRNVQEIGNYAFGNTHVEFLQLPASLHSSYGRQFKVHI